MSKSGLRQFRYILLGGRRRFGVHVGRGAVVTGIYYAHSRRGSSFTVLMFSIGPSGPTGIGLYALKDVLGKLALVFGSVLVGWLGRDICNSCGLNPEWVTRR